MKFDKVYQDDLPPEQGRRYRIVEKENGTVAIEDVTEYLQQGTPLLAKDMNQITDFCKQVGNAISVQEIESLMKGG